MIRWASGSIQVVTNVARLRCGSPSMARSSPTSRIASTGRMPPSGKWVDGAASVRKRLPKRDWAGLSGARVMLPMQTRPDRCEHHPSWVRVSSWSGLVEGLHHAADDEADGPEERPPVGDAEVDRRGGGRPGVRRHAGQEEQHRPDLVDGHDPPADLVERAPRSGRGRSRARPGAPTPGSRRSPSMSGIQIQVLACRTVRFSANAATRLTANSRVPTNSTAALSQPRLCGRDSHQRQRAEVSEPSWSMSVGALAACSAEAIATQAEEEAADEVDGVDVSGRADRRPGRRARPSANSEPPMDERHGGDEVDPGQPSGRDRLGPRDARWPHPRRRGAPPGRGAGPDARPIGPTCRRGGPRSSRW